MKTPECVNKVVWGILIQEAGQNPFPACNDHFGRLMELVFSKYGDRIGFMYVGNLDVGGARCCYQNAERSVSLSIHESLNSDTKYADGFASISVTPGVEVR